MLINKKSIVIVTIVTTIVKLVIVLIIHLLNGMIQIVKLWAVVPVGNDSRRHRNIRDDPNESNFGGYSAVPKLVGMEQTG